MVTVVGQNMFWNGVLQLGVATWRVVPEIDCVGLLILSSPFLQVSALVGFYFQVDLNRSPSTLNLYPRTQQPAAPVSDVLQWESLSGLRMTHLGHWASGL